VRSAAAVSDGRDAAWLCRDTDFDTDDERALFDSSDSDDAPAPRAATQPASPTARGASSAAAVRAAAAEPARKRVAVAAAGARSLPLLPTPAKPPPPRVPAAVSPDRTLSASERACVETELRAWEVGVMATAHPDTIPHARKQQQRARLVAEALRRRAAAGATVGGASPRASPPSAPPPPGCAHVHASPPGEAGIRVGVRAAPPSLLAARLQQLGLVRRAVSGSRDRCCWYALAHQLAGSPGGCAPFRDDAAMAALQRALVALLQQRGAVWSATEDGAAWAAEMARVSGDGAYVGDAVLRAAADTHNRHVVVIPCGNGGVVRLFPARPHHWLLRGAAAGKASLAYEFDDWRAFMRWWTVEAAAPASDDADDEEEQGAQGERRASPPQRGACVPMVLLHNGMQGCAAHFESTQAPSARDALSGGDDSSDGAVMYDNDDDDDSDDDGMEHAPGSLGALLAQLRHVQRQLNGAACAGLSEEEVAALREERAPLLEQLCVSGPADGDTEWPSFKAQVAATVAAVHAFAVQQPAAARAQLHMACGTGKTAVSKWTLDALAAHAGVRDALVLVPSLQLLRQVLHDFSSREAGSAPFPLARCRIITVCSDAKVHDADGDDALEDLSLRELQRTLPAGVSTSVASSVEQLAAFLQSCADDDDDGEEGTLNLVLCTYQSSPLLKVRVHALFLMLSPQHIGCDA
jgi:hypothetical protein